jgi:hypothetical protein
MMVIKKNTKTWFTSDDGFDFMFQPIEDTLTIKKTDAGFKVKYLTYDDDYQLPNEWESDAFLVHYHCQFDVRDKRVTEEDLTDLFFDKIPEDEQENHPLKDYWVFFTSALIHSGVWLKLGGDFSEDPGDWDTSRCGAVLVPKDDHYNTQKKARQAAQCLIDIWNQALSGDVYGCVSETYDKDKKQINYDSCWGFYGYDYAVKSLNDEF